MKRHDSCKRTYDAAPSPSQNIDADIEAGGSEANAAYDDISDFRLTARTFPRSLHRSSSPPPFHRLAGCCRRTKNECQVANKACNRLVK